MEKITLKALELAGYKDANVIAKIISYVPNPQAAAEMLLGVYTPRTVDTEQCYRKHRYDSRKQIVLISSYDDLANTVTVRSYTQKTKQGWYATKDDKASGNHTFEKPKGECYDWEYIPVAGYENTQQVFDIPTFEEEYPKVITTQEALRTLELWSGILDLQPENML